MRKVLLAGIITLALAKVVPISFKTQLEGMDTNVVGPFEAYAPDSEISYTFKISRTERNVVESLRVTNATTGSLLYTSNKPSHALAESLNYTATFPLYTHSYLGANGIKILFTLKINSEVFYEKEATLYPLQKEEVHVTRDGLTRVKSNVISFQIRSEILRNTLDDFNFVGLEDYVNTDTYYSLSLNNISFLYNEDLFRYSSANLSFNDKESKFKYLKHTNGKINLPLDVLDNGETKRFAYRNSFYVNKLNLDTADYYISGFVETDKLYFPVNSKDYFLGTEIELTIKDCGYNHYDLIFNLTYDVYRELIGSCNVSDFCIRGEVE